MIEPAPLLVLGSMTVAGFGMVSAAALSGWNGWLALRRLEVGNGRGGPLRTAAGAGIEVAGLRERVRRLEAIANGAEL